MVENIVPCTDPAPRHFFMMSWLRPARSPTRTISAIKAMHELTKRFVTTFMVAPEPLGPVCVTSVAKGSRIGRTRSKASELPPTMIEIVRVSTRLCDPEIGASSISIPCSASFPASEACHEGCIVLIST